MSGEVVAIEFVRRQYRELVDGTLEVKVHIQPFHKDAFLRLFPSIDMPGAMAPLKPVAKMSVAEAAESAARSAAKHDMRLSEYAALRCKDEKFHEFLMECWPSAWSAAKTIGGSAEQAARTVVCGALAIESRAELDSDAEVAARFHRVIREPFAQWHAKNA